MLNTTKQETLGNEIAECGNNSKKLYLLVKHLTGTMSNNPLPKHDDEETLANEFADFFIGKIKKIRQELDNKPEYKPITSNIQKLNSFKAVTKDEIKLIINKLATKTCELDPGPTSLLKAILSAILPTITTIMNTSLKHGIFTNKWKIEIICPLLKKAGLDLILKNYRPVSNLSILSMCPNTIQQPLQ